jgi:N-glycosylase/DNA lyase
MDYKIAEQFLGIQKERNTVLTDVRFFDLAQTLDNGQAFRWREVSPGQFSGIAHGRRLNLFFENGELTLQDVSLEEFEATWKGYFDFNRDYNELRSRFLVCENLSKAMEFSPGLRLMRQDVWEVLISFILSQNSNIPRIKKMIELLCENFGESLPCGSHTFPAPEALAEISPEALAPIKCGYRAAYIIDAARRTASGEFNPLALENAESDEVFGELLKIHGVGPKVANCVLLFGFGRVERYPVDVWIKRAMEQFYPSGFPEEIKEFSGIAQQFLFHYMRNLDMR